MGSYPAQRFWGWGPATRAWWGGVFVKDPGTKTLVGDGWRYEGRRAPSPGGGRMSSEASLAPGTRLSVSRNALGTTARPCRCATGVRAGRSGAHRAPPRDRCPSISTDAAPTPVRTMCWRRTRQLAHPVEPERRPRAVRAEVCPLPPPRRRPLGSAPRGDERRQARQPISGQRPEEFGRPGKGSSKVLGGLNRGVPIPVFVTETSPPWSAATQPIPGLRVSHGSRPNWFTPKSAPEGGSGTA